MAQIHRDAVVPIGGGDVLQFVAVVIAGIVDQHIDGPQLFEQRRHLIKIAQIQAMKDRRDSGVRQLGDQGCGLLYAAGKLILLF